MDFSGYGFPGSVGLMMGLRLPTNLVLIAAAVVLLVWAVRRLSEPPRSRDDALEILHRRLAGGEISLADCEQTRRAVQAGITGGASARPQAEEV